MQAPSLRADQDRIVDLHPGLMRHRRCPTDQFVGLEAELGGLKKNQCWFHCKNFAAKTISFGVILRTNGYYVQRIRRHAIRTTLTGFHQRR